MWQFTLLYNNTPKIANIIPRIFGPVTGFPKMKRDAAITKILLLAFATAYVRGVTKDSTLKAIIFWSQFKTPSITSRMMVFMSTKF